MDNERVIDILNKLIETCKDGEYGFRTCAEHVDSQHLRTVFLDRAESCRKGAMELQAEVARLGGKPEDRGTAAGAMHRAWIDLRTAVTSKDEKAVLAECERGEDHAVKEYKDALSKSLPENLRMVVQRQATEVQRAHDSMRSLRDAEKAAEH